MGIEHTKEFQVMCDSVFSCRRRQGSLLVWSCQAFIAATIIPWLRSGVHYSKFLHWRASTVSLTVKNICSFAAMFPKLYRKYYRLLWILLNNYGGSTATFLHNYDSFFFFFFSSMRWQVAEFHPVYLGDGEWLGKDMTAAAAAAPSASHSTGKTRLSNPLVTGVVGNPGTDGGAAARA